MQKRWQDVGDIIQIFNPHRHIQGIDFEMCRDIAGCEVNTLKEVMLSQPGMTLEVSGSLMTALEPEVKIGKLVPGYKSVVLPGTTQVALLPRRWPQRLW